MFNGTSAAAPQVTGAAALVASGVPGPHRAPQIKQRILNGVDPIGHIGNNRQKPTADQRPAQRRQRPGRRAAGARHKAPAAVGDLAPAGVTFQSVTPDLDGHRRRRRHRPGRLLRPPLLDLADHRPQTWDAARRVLGEPGPKAAGAAETFTVSGLDPATTYYFALKVRDDMGNESALSRRRRGGRRRRPPPCSRDDVEDGTNGWTATGLWHRSPLPRNSRRDLLVLRRRTDAELRHRPANGGCSPRRRSTCGRRRTRC